MGSDELHGLPVLLVLVAILAVETLECVQVRQSGQSAQVHAVPSLLMQQTFVLHLALSMSLSPLS